MQIWQAVIVGGASFIAGFMFCAFFIGAQNLNTAIDKDYYEAAYNLLAGQTGYQVNPLTGQVEEVEK